MIAKRKRNPIKKSDPNTTSLLKLLLLFPFSINSLYLLHLEQIPSICLTQEFSTKTNFLENTLAETREQSAKEKEKNINITSAKTRDIPKSHTSTSSPLPENDREMPSIGDWVCCACIQHNERHEKRCKYCEHECCNCCLTATARITNPTVPQQLLIPAPLSTSPPPLSIFNPPPPEDSNSTPPRWQCCVDDRLNNFCSSWRGSCSHRIYSGCSEF